MSDKEVEFGDFRQIKTIFPLFEEDGEEGGSIVVKKIVGGASCGKDTFKLTTKSAAWKASVYLYKDELIHIAEKILEAFPEDKS